jgi:SAM-dependent methyltransferase
MSLLPAAELPALLVCPRCRSKVRDDEDEFRCGSAACELSAPGSFPVVDGWPALIDFERSVVQRAELPRSTTGGSRWPIELLPARARALWKPSNRIAAQNAARLLELFDDPAPLILVVGGGVVGNGVEALYRDPRARVLGCDLYGSPVVQLIADAHELPLADESVDAVVVQAVLHQLLDPVRAVAEIHRVLRRDGLVYAETPFLQQVNAGAYDFIRYTSSGHRYLFRAFEEVAAGPVAGPGTQMLTSVDHLVRGMLRFELAGKLARLLFFWLRYLDRVVPTAFAMDNASAYFFLGRRSDHALTPHEILRYYRGAQRVGRTEATAIA